jgi:hypothetical protein
MRALYRTVAAIALGLPLVLAGSAMANAATPDAMSSHSDKDKERHHHHHFKFKIDLDQDLKQSADQKNHFGPVLVSGNHNKFVTEQENESMQSGSQDPFSK